MLTKTREAALAEIHKAIGAMTLGLHEAPSVKHYERPLYRRILVAYDGSDGAKLALEWAKDLAHRHGSEILVGNAYSPPNLGGGAMMGYAWYPQIAELYEAAESWARNLAEETVQDLREAGLKAKAYAVQGSPARQLSRLAHDHDANLVVVGAQRHQRIERMLLGSTAIGLLEHAPCSILVARTSPRPSRVLVATDGSEVSYRAVAHALHLASEVGAELVVQHVMDYPEEAEERHPEGLLKAVVEKIRLPAAPPRVRYVLDVGHAATRILLRGGEEDAGLLVLGSHGKGAVERAFLGSVSRRVAIESRASVLVAKA